MLEIHALPGEAKADLMSSAFVFRGHECHWDIAFWPDWKQTAIRISKGALKGMFQTELTSTEMMYQKKSPTEMQQKDLKSLHVLNAFDHDLVVAEM